MGARGRTLVTGNYEIETTSAIEYAFVATPDSPPEGGWPVEEKLRRAQNKREEAADSHSLPPTLTAPVSLTATSATAADATT